MLNVGGNLYPSCLREGGIRRTERNPDRVTIPTTRPSLPWEPRENTLHICWDVLAEVVVVGAFSLCRRCHSQNHRCSTPVYQERRKNLKRFNRLLIFRVNNWCCRTGLNCRPLPYQGSALPLSYGSMESRKESAQESRHRPRFLPQAPRWRKHWRRPGRARSDPVPSFRPRRPRFDQAEAGGEGRIARYLAGNCLADFSGDGSKAQGRRQGFAAGSAEGGAARKSQAQKVARKRPGGDHAVVQSG